MKKIVTWALALSVAGHAHMVSAIEVKSSNFTTSQLENGTGGANSFLQTAVNFIAFLVSLLYFVALVYALWGGFQILTAWGDEEKVKKGKTTLIHAVIGLIVIFLASTIVNFVIGTMTGSVVS